MTIVASIHVGGGRGLIKKILNDSCFPACKPHSFTRQWRSSIRLLLRSKHYNWYHPYRSFISKSTILIIIIMFTMQIICCLQHLLLIPWSNLLIQNIYKVSAFPFLRHVPTRSYTASISSSTSSVFLYRRNVNFNTESDNTNNNSSSIIINKENIYDPSSLATLQYTSPKIVVSSSNAAVSTTSRTPSTLTQTVMGQKNITSHNNNNNATMATITNTSNSSITTGITNRIRLPLSVTSSLGDIMSIAATSITPTTISPRTGQVNDSTTIRNDSDDGAQFESTTTSSIINTNKQSLQDMYQIYHPLDRMILTANGNVQRLISSYYDTKYYAVHVNVIYCQLRPRYDIPTNTAVTIPTTTGSTRTSTTATTTIDTTQNNQDHDNPTIILPQIWDRKVELCLYTTSTTTNTDKISPVNGIDDEDSKHHHVFCRATSIITIHDLQCQQLIALQQIGIGQLFRYYNILPNFTLHNAGPLPSPSHNNNDDTTTTTTSNIGDNDGGGNFWREYTLSCPQLSCWIREEFPPGLWNISQFFVP